ncbi:sensor histidine kinase [Intrasporangium sp.]|uniref:sensor histidine kinase n=1 Tax=Intrasporangium sp. TaxID=1925024 RepID=UPI00293B0E47|nr:sensor histidine kinase [Intrasporangium sp.]MDV3222625.1 sensor histidine kinase [Intrasporangium sp.]
MTADLTWAARATSPGRDRVRLGEAQRRHVALAAVSATGLSVAATLYSMATLPITPVEGVDGRVATALFVTGMMLLAAAGAAVLWQGPSTMGWLLVGTGLANALGRATYAVAFVADSAGHASAPWLGWLTNWSWIPGQACALVLFLRFPTGGLPSPRWRHVERALVAYAAVLVVVTAVLPGPLGAEPLDHHDNPFGLEPLAPVLDGALSGLFAVLPVAVLVSLAGPALRWRRATDVERRQLRWVAAALAFVAFVAVAVLVSGALLDAGPGPASFVEGLAYLVLPATVVFAIARHGLWGVEVGRRLDRLHRVRAEERTRLQRELHDSVGPLLGSISMRAEAARRLVASATDSGRVDEVLSSIEADAEGALVEVRRLIDELGPAPLAEQQLGEALSGLVRSYDGATTSVTLSTGALPDLDPATEVAAYRIVAEALRNVMRHARAGRCDVRLHVTDGELHLQVTDDGVGLGGNPAGVGRRGMAARADALGGAVRIHDAPGGGTVVTAVLPGAPA